MQELSLNEIEQVRADASGGSKARSGPFVILRYMNPSGLPPFPPGKTVAMASPRNSVTEQTE